VAAEATQSLNVGSLVLDNDFRHPVLLAKEVATLDLMCEGRLEFGIGAGWMISDYEQSGIAFDRPGVRIDRLSESLEIMNALWATGTATFSGTHYEVQGAVGAPRPFRRPRPTVVIGGGSRRVLSLAARQADIVGFVPSLAAGRISAEVAQEATAEKFAERVQWVREAAGSRFDDLELQSWTMAVQVVDNRTTAIEQLAGLFGMAPEQLASSPLGLFGTTEEIIETLQERRETYGFSYVVVHEAELESLAPVVAKLANT
jgi:probable F420-dependent oxidoreductase